VSKDWRHTSTNLFPQIEPQLLLTFYKHIVAHHAKLVEEGASKEVAAKHVKLLITYLETEHKKALAAVKNLLSHGEITFEYLWAILIPRTIVFVQCPITKLPRAVRLRVATKEKGFGNRLYWNLSCDYTDFFPGNRDEPAFFGQAEETFEIHNFRGRVPISSLRIVPLSFHPHAEKLGDELVARGKQWADLQGRYHKQYDDTAYAYNSCNGNWFKVNVSSRVMVDRRRQPP
jgi:hypothetical protein